MLRVGVIGCGTIGAEICVAIVSGLVQAELVGIHDVMAAATERVAQRLRRATPVLLQEAVIEAADLVVEATSRDVAPGIIRAALGHGRDILVMSVGGLLACLDDALALAQNGNRHIYVPTGAIAALDAVKGATVAMVSRVTLTTRKPPKALAGAYRRKRARANHLAKGCRLADPCKTDVLNNAVGLQIVERLQNPALPQNVPHGDRGWLVTARQCNGIVELEKSDLLDA